MALVFNQVYLLTNPEESREDSFHLIALGARTRSDDVGPELQVITNDAVGGHGFRVREVLSDDVTTGVVEIRDGDGIAWRFEPLTVAGLRDLPDRYEYPDHLYRFTEDEDLRSYFREQFLYDGWEE